MENHIRKQHIAKLKSAIEENAQKSIALRIDAQFEKGLERHKLHLKKGYIGYETRRYLLAYAFLRGIPYRACEPITHDYFDYSSIIYAIKNLEIELDRESLRNWVAGITAEREVA